MKCRSRSDEGEGAGWCRWREQQPLHVTYIHIYTPPLCIYHHHHHHHHLTNHFWSSVAVENWLHHWYHPTVNLSCDSRCNLYHHCHRCVIQQNHSLRRNWSHHSMVDLNPLSIRLQAWMRNHLRELIDIILLIAHLTIRCHNNSKSSRIQKNIVRGLWIR